MRRRYTIGCIAYLVIIWHLALHGRAGAQAKGSKVGSFFFAISEWLSVGWNVVAGSGGGDHRDWLAVGSFFFSLFYETDEGSDSVKRLFLV